MGDDETLRDIEQAKQRFDTEIAAPDPNAGRRTFRRSGSVTAKLKGTAVIAGCLTFSVEEDKDGIRVVRTTQFTTNPDFRRQHVALLLAYVVREHFGVDEIHSSPMRLEEGGAGVIASLRRRGIMAPMKTPE